MATKKYLIIISMLMNICILNASKKSANCAFQKTQIVLEKIYAVMITGKDDFHKHLAEKSVQSFLQQTYPNKHLIIINDGNYSLGHINKELITEIKLDKKYILGVLRNMGIKQIPENGIYLQWDDDDWHHPSLMEKQYAYMKAQAADACILRSQVVYSFEKNAAWISSPKRAIMGKPRRGIEGTIMCRRKSDISYPVMVKSEDSVFINKYAQKYKFVIWKNPDFYYVRFIHGHNTWNDSHFSIDRRQQDSWLIPEASRIYLAKIMNLFT